MQSMHDARRWFSALSLAPGGWYTTPMVMCVVSLGRWWGRRASHSTSIIIIIIIIKLLPLFGGYVVTNVACHSAVLPAVSSVLSEECIFRQAQWHIHNVVVAPCFSYASYINSLLCAHSMNLIDLPRHASVHASVQHGGKSRAGVLSSSTGNVTRLDILALPAPPARSV